MLAIHPPSNMATVALVQGNTMSDTIMAEEVQPEKKTAFANRKYTNEERIKKDEEEVKNIPSIFNPSWL